MARSSRRRPAKPWALTRCVALLLLLLQCAGNAGAQSRKPASAPPPPDFLDRLKKELTTRLSAIDVSDRAARAAGEKLRPGSRFLNAVNGVELPEGPSRERVEALRREVALLDRIAVHQRGLREIAVKREKTVQDAHTLLQAAIDKRRPISQPSRGPLARSDPLLERLLEYEPALQKQSLAATQTVADATSALNAFLRTQQKAGALLEKAETAWAAELARRTAAEDKKKKALLAERNRLAARWKRLVKEQEALTDARDGPEARLRSALAPGARTEENRPLDDLIRNVCARAALHTAIEARNELGRIAERESHHLEAVADFHRDWGRYLEACRRAGVRLPVVPGLDSEASRKAAVDATLAARQKAAEPVRIARENARTREVIALLDAEGESIAERYLRRGDLGGSFPPLPRYRPITIPSLPEGSSAALATAQEEARAARTARRRTRNALTSMRGEAVMAVRAAGNAAVEASRLSLRDPAFAARRRELTAARDRLVELASGYRALLKKDRQAALDLEARCAKLDRLIAAHPTEDRTTFRWRFENEWQPALRRRVSRLPGTGTLLIAVGVILVLGLLAGRVRRPRGPAMIGLGLCFLAAVGLAGVGLVRSGPAAQALGVAGAATAVILAWALPLNLLAGLRLRWSGRGRPGELVWNDRVKGRVAKRGLFRSLLVRSQSAAGTTETWVGNRHLVRSRRPLPATAEAPLRSPLPPADATASPDRGEERALHFHIRLDSDWMASRQLVGLIARRHDERAEVHFEVHPSWIRLTVRWQDGAVDRSRLDAEARRVLRAAPFARLVEASGMRGQGSASIAARRAARDKP